jgi:hypothetical protein
VDDWETGRSTFYQWGTSYGKAKAPAPADGQPTSQERDEVDENYGNAQDKADVERIEESI